MLRPTMITLFFLFLHNHGVCIPYNDRNGYPVRTCDCFQNNFRQNGSQFTSRCALGPYFFTTSFGRSQIQPFQIFGERSPLIGLSDRDQWVPAPKICRHNSKYWARYHHLCNVLLSLRDCFHIYITRNVGGMRHDSLYSLGH